MSLTVANINNTLDNLYANKSVEDFTERFISPVYKEIERGDSKLISSKGVNYLRKTQAPNYIRSKAFGVNPGEQFAKASNSKYALMNVTAIQNDATIEWDGDVDVQNNKSALKEAPAKGVDWVKSEMKDIYKAYAEERSRQIWQARENEVARISATNTGTNTITCENSGNLFGTQLIKAGMFLEIRDNAGTLRCYVVVDTVNRTGKSFKVKNNVGDALKYRIRDTNGAALTAIPAGVVDGDRIYPEGGFNNGWAGLKYLYGTSGSFQSVADRTTEYQLSGVAINAAGAAMSYLFVRRLVSSLRYTNDGMKVKGKFYASAQTDAWESTLLAAQYNNNARGSADIGYEEDDMRVLGKKVAWDSYVPRDEFHYVNTAPIDRFELMEFGAYKKADGGYVREKPGDGMGYDAFQIHFKGIGNLGTENPNEIGGYIYNLSVAGLALGN